MITTLYKRELKEPIVNKINKSDNLRREQENRNHQDHNKRKRQPNQDIIESQKVQINIEA